MSQTASLGGGHHCCVLDRNLGTCRPGTRGAKCTNLCVCCTYQWGHQSVLEPSGEAGKVLHPWASPQPHEAWSTWVSGRHICSHLPHSLVWWCRLWGKVSWGAHCVPFHWLPGSLDPSFVFCHSSFPQAVVLNSFPVDPSLNSLAFSWHSVLVPWFVTSYCKLPHSIIRWVFWDLHFTSHPATLGLCWKNPYSESSPFSSPGLARLGLLLIA